MTDKVLVLVLCVNTMCLLKIRDILEFKVTWICIAITCYETNAKS